MFRIIGAALGLCAAVLFTSTAAIAQDAEYYESYFDDYDTDSAYDTSTDYDSWNYGSDSYSDYDAATVDPSETDTEYQSDADTEYDYDTDTEHDADTEYDYDTDTEYSHCDEQDLDPYYSDLLNGLLLDPPSDNPVMDFRIRTPSGICGARG